MPFQKQRTVRTFYFRVNTFGANITRDLNAKCDLLFWSNALLRNISDIRGEKKIDKYLLSLLIDVGSNAVLIAVLLAPEALDDAAVYLCVVGSLYGVRRRFLSREFDERVSLVLENSNILNGTKRRESFGYQLICDSAGETAAIDCAVCWTTLVVHLQKSQVKCVLVENANSFFFLKKNKSFV